MVAEGIRQDLVYGARRLGRTPGFTGSAVLMLALGISAVTVIYSVIRHVLLEPFPYADSARLVNVIVQDPSGKTVGSLFGAAEFLDYAEQTTAFEGVVGTKLQPALYVTSGNIAARLNVAWMTPNGLTFLGVSPMLGRTFGVGDSGPGAPPVAVLSYQAWTRDFGADPSILGTSLNVNGQPWTVVGVMPSRFEWYSADVWLPAPLTRSADPKSYTSTRGLRARLRPNVSLREAETQLDAIAERRAAVVSSRYPPGSRFVVVSLIEFAIRDFGQIVYTLFGAVALLLTIACCNVANMLLARTVERKRELSTRVAIGASPKHILRLVFAESALLTLGGLILGIGLTYLGVEALVHLMPMQGVPPEAELRVDGTVLSFSLIVASSSMFAVGLFPALYISRRLSTGVRRDGLTSDMRVSPARTRNILAGAQVALSVVLLLGAGLLLRTFVQLTSVDLGFDPRNLFVTGLVFPPDSLRAENGAPNDYRPIIDRVQALPGVVAVAASSARGTFAGSTSPFEVLGVSAPPSEARVQLGSEQLPDALGLGILAGRRLTGDDIRAGRQVALVNETLAIRHFGRAALAVGREIRLPELTRFPNPRFTVVGVVADSANVDLRQPPEPHVFLPLSPSVSAPTLIIRTGSDPRGVARLVRTEIQSTSGPVAFAFPETFEDYLVRAFYERPRFNAFVLGSFGCFGFILAVMGVYSVLGYAAAERTREVAIRRALGATRLTVLGHVLQRGLRMVLAGMVIGIVASFFTSRMLVDQLGDTPPNDPLTHVLVIGSLLLSGSLASLVPAVRVARSDLIKTLRCD
jgi:predicted permease